MNDSRSQISDRVSESVKKLSVFAIFGEIWLGRYVILVTAIICLVVTTVGVLVTYRPLYQSTAILEKKRDEQPAGANSLLASLQGKQDFPLYEQFKAEVSSLTLAQQIETRYHVLSKLYPKQWDNVHKQWMKPDTLTIHIKDFLSPLLQTHSWHPPDAETLRDYIEARIDIKTTAAEQLFEIKYNNEDPKISFDFLNMVITEVNLLLKRQKEKELASRVALLNETFNSANFQSYRTALVDQIISDEVHRLVTQADTNYAVSVIDPVNTSLWPRSPRWAFYWAISLVAGMLLGILIVFIRNGLRQYKIIELHFENSVGGYVMRTQEITNEETDEQPRAT